MTATIAAPAAPAAPSTSSTPATPSNGADPKAGQPSSEPKPASAKAQVNNEPGAKPGETAAQTRQRMKLKLRKLDGPGEEELELDETEIGRYVQKARVADKQRGEFDKQRSEWESQQAEALKDPLKFFRERGVDLVELGKQEAARAEEMAKMDPMQRAIAERDAKIAQYEAERAAAAEKAKADAEAQAERELVLAEQTLIKSAIAASGREPKSAGEAGYLFRLYADVREMAEHAGVPLTAEQLAAAGDKLELDRFTSMAKRVSGDAKWRGKNMAALKALAEALSTGMDDAGLMDFFGPKTAARLARAQLAAFRKNPLPTVADPQPPAGEAPQTARRQPNGRAENELSILDGLGR